MERDCVICVYNQTGKPEIESSNYSYSRYRELQKVELQYSRNSQWTQEGDRKAEASNGPRELHPLSWKHI